MAADLCYHVNATTRQEGTKMHNKDIRDYAARRRVWLWEIAMELGINDSSLSRKLRKELTQDEKEKILGIIDQLAKGAV